MALVPSWWWLVVRQVMQQRPVACRAILSTVENTTMRWEREEHTIPVHDMHGGGNAKAARRRELKRVN